MFIHMKRAAMAMLLLSSVTLAAWSANRKTTVKQVTTEVTLSDDVDYIISDATAPFTGEGLVNITNTDHAVVILSNIKPSKAIASWLKYIKIDGAKAVNNSNCQVKLYNLGCIILPYGNSARPLTCFTEPNFLGDTCNTYGTGNTGGYMNTLTARMLNNRIRSFKLKRGYMVTFSLRESGRGYSRCFIAADQDLEVASLPAVMDQKISSYRVFKWYDAGKKQLANYMDQKALSALNVQSSYDWGQGNSSFLPDYEWVPNHIYEDWPSSATIGGTSQSPHTKTNNEPRNSADDHPQDLATILNNWENMMRTGLRLCSPASWDGSDYWNATGFLAEFLDSIDARGWRCDIIDLHCYWPESNFGNIANWSNKYKRPVWISEWCWGASWNNNGAFASGVTEAQVKSALQRICTSLNGMNYVERYYYWNSERDPSRLYKNGTLTPAGEYYASMNSGLGYNGRYDFVPTTPKQYGPSKFKTTFSNGSTIITWYDANGEFNQLMEIQMKDADGAWVTLDTIAQKEAASNYSYTAKNSTEESVYRLHLVDLDGKDYYTNDDMSVGDGVAVGDKTLYAGGNIFPNGEFDLGFTGWLNGTGKELTEPQFQVVADGGYKGGSYLQAHTNGSMNGVQSVKQVVDLVPGQNYLLRIALVNGGNSRFALTADGSALTKVVQVFDKTTEWSLQSVVFNADTYSKGLLALYALAAKGQADHIELYQLFENRDEAIADGLAKARLRAEAQKAFNTDYAALNTDLDQQLAAITATDAAALAAAQLALDNHLKAVAALKALPVAEAALKAVEQHPCPYHSWMVTLADDARKAATASSVISLTDELQTLIGTHLSFGRASKQPRYPTFASGKTDGWEVKAGTFTGGDQQATTKLGQTCWNAWWATTNQNATMEIRQTITDLPEGYYQLDCRATTEHFCITDQHSYLKTATLEAVSPTLSKDYFDLPVGGTWATASEVLTTAPVYVEPSGSLTVGFVSSKKGAVNGKWHKFGETAAGDNREGWWCASNFVLKYHAIDDLTGIRQVSASKTLSDGTYTLDGRTVDEGQLKAGLYIRVSNGRAVKTIVR